MGLADRVSAAVGEKRAIGGVPWTPYVPFGSGGPARPSRYHRGQDSAISLTPVYGAVRLLADGVASLPLRVYRQVPDGTKQRWTGPSIFDQPGPRGTLYDWLFEMMSSLLLQGNALGYITSRDGFGFPTTIVWLPFERCHIQDEETPDFANPVKPRFYYCGREMAEENLLHIKAFSVPGRTAGISPLRAFQILFETGHNLQHYGSEWFNNGGFPPGTFRNSEIEININQSREIRENLMETLRARQPLVYGRDWEYQPVSVPPGEAQFVETHRLTATQIAAIYGVPPERIGGTKGDSLTYSTQEQGTNDLITWSLRPWLVRAESAFFTILPAQRYCRFFANAMVRTDTLARFQSYQIARQIGLQTIAEQRDDDDLAPLTSAVADEELPLDVLVAMARGMAAVPKSFSRLIEEAKPPPAPAGHQPEPGTPGPGAGSNPPLNVVPPGSSPPVQANSGGPRYSAEDIAVAVYGLAGRRKEYVDLVCLAARDGGYAVSGTRAGEFGKEQAEWIASAVRDRPRPVEHLALNGNGNGNHG